MKTDKTTRRDGVLTLRGDAPQSAYRLSVALKALCEDDMDSGSSLGDLQLWSDPDTGDIKIGYTA